MPRSAQPIVVGTTHFHYATTRNISGLPFQNVSIRRAPNLFRVPNYLWFKLTGKAHPYWLNLHYDAGLGSYDLLHFFNGIHLGRRPWITTFETFLPRWGSYGHQNLRWGLKQLAKPNCKHIIALSDSALAFQRDILKSFPQEEATILPKLSVLHPAQAPLVESWEAKPLPSDRIHLVLTGADFFRKGGLQVLRVVDHLLSQNAPLHLHIVSTLNTHDYATQASDQDLKQAKTLIARHPQHISYHPSLPNVQVLDLYRRAHIGLLPTWADTYGYTVLEAQAAACATITTDIRALPEINTPETGWLIHTHRDPHGNALLDTTQQRQTFAQHLESQLEDILQEVLQHPETLRTKGQASLQRIRTQHSPESRAAILESLYNSFLSR